MVMLLVPVNYAVHSAPKADSSTNADQATQLWLQTGVMLEVEQ